MDSALFPSTDEVRRILALSPDQDMVSSLVETSLLDPLKHFFRKPGKGIRGQIVQLGYQLSPEHREAVLTLEDEALCAKAAIVMEALHGASLVVDDIEDNSFYRRGGPTLHRTVGIPVALNAGNWLYFWPLYWISSWKLDPPREMALYRLCHQALLQAHFGQALDVGVPVDALDRKDIWPVCLKSLELKTGALMSLGMGLGAALGQADEARTKLLKEFATNFGVALQMFDDIGNCLSSFAGPKQYEDLKLRRPSFVWAFAAQEMSEVEFESFRRAVSELPSETALQNWFGETLFFERAKACARKNLDALVLAFCHRLQAQGDFENSITRIQGLSETLKNAYQ